MTNRVCRLGSTWWAVAAVVVVGFVVSPDASGQPFDPPYPETYPGNGYGEGMEWTGDDDARWNQPGSWRLYDPAGVFLDPDGAFPDGRPDGANNVGLWDNADPALADLDPWSDPNYRELGRAVFTNLGGTNVRVDEPSLGASQWRVYSIDFARPRVWDDDINATREEGSGNSYRLYGNTIYIGEGGIWNNSRSTQTIENNIWLWDDTVIFGGTRLEMGAVSLGETEINTSGSSGTASELTLAGWIHLGGFIDEEEGFAGGVYGPVITGDGDVVFAGDTFIFQDNTYTGLTTLAGRVMVGSDEAFGDPNVGSNVVRVVDTFGEARISAFAEPVTLGQNFELYSDLNIGGTSFEYESGGAITFAGQIELFDDDRTVTTETLTTTSFTGGVELNDNDLTVFNFGNSRLTISNTIAGSGGLVKDGPGTLRLTGSNTFTGDVTFNFGTLEVESGAVFGNSDNIIVAGRTSLRALNNPITISQAIALNENLVILSGPSFMFADTMTVNENVALELLNTTTTTLAGNTSIDLDDNNIFTVLGPGNLNITGAIVGDGDFRHDGTGTVRLSGVSSYNGDARVHGGGTLRVMSGGVLSATNTTIQDSNMFVHGEVRDNNGVLITPAGVVDGNVTVGRFSTLGGGGVIDGNLTLGDRSELRPGDSIGSLTVGGNATWQAGSRTYIEYRGTNDNDTILVESNATIDQGSRFVMSNVGEGYVQSGDTFTVIESDGTMTVNANRADLVESEASLFLQFLVDDDAIDNNIGLVVTADRQSFESAAQGRNNLALSRQLDSLGTSNPNSDAIRLLRAIETSVDVADYNQRLRQLSPAAYTGAVDTTFEMNRAFSNSLHEQARAMRQGHFGVSYDQYGFSRGSNNSASPSGGAMASAQPYLWDDSYEDRLRSNDRLRSRDERPTTTRDTRVPYTLDVEDRRWNVFATGFGIHDSIDSTNERAGLRATTGGFLVGADYSFTENFFAGLSGGYSYTDISFRENRGDGDINSFRFGPYAGYTYERYFVDASLSYGYHDHSYDQNVNIGGFDEQKESSFNAHDISLHLSGGYDYLMPNERTSIIPLVGLDYVHYRRDSFTESGGGASNFDIDSETVNSLETMLGVRFEHRYFTDGATIVPNAFVGFAYEFLADDNDVTASLVGTQETFTVRGPSPDRASFRAGAGVRALLSDRVQGFVQYNGRFQSDVQTHAVNAGLSFRF